MNTGIYLPQILESLFNPPDSSTEDIVYSSTEDFVQGGIRLAPSELCPPPSHRSVYYVSYYVSPWCASASKRVFDLICVVPALLALSPLLAIVAAVVRCTSPGSVIFRQQRAGSHRRLFTIYKFRTMVQNSEASGPGLTAAGDPRITRIGHFLRRFKLDELPQLFNVLCGDMSLVGPRPKLPELELTSVPCRPGITGAATLLFRKEQHMLREIPAAEIGGFYAQYIAPAKVHTDAEYMKSASLRSDLHILRKTLVGGGHHATRENLVALRPVTHPA